VRIQAYHPRGLTAVPAPPPRSGILQRSGFGAPSSPEARRRTTTAQPFPTSAPAGPSRNEGPAGAPLAIEPTVATSLVDSSVQALAVAAAPPPTAGIAPSG